MDKLRKKELQQQYMNAKHPMGIFIVRNSLNNKVHIQATPDLRGVMNGTRVKLGYGRHPVRELQKDWNELGGENFSIEILEHLQYDERDQDKSDYSEELQLLQLLWEEKLTLENLVFYKR